MAIYDTPAYIDYITSQTGASKIKYIGHSQGTVIGFALFSSCAAVPATCAKVDVAVMLAPIPYGINTAAAAAPVLHSEQALHVRVPGTNTPAPPINIRNQEYKYDLAQTALHAFCNEARSKICYDVVCLSFGCLAPTNYLPQSSDNIFGYYPQPSSDQNNLHWDQFVGPLTYFDFGNASLNVLHYGSATPPVYNVSAFAVDLALLYGSDDPTAASLTNGGRALLPQDRIVYERNFTGYGHADFVWGIDASQTVYPEVLQLFEQRDAAAK